MTEFLDQVKCSYMRGCDCGRQPGAFCSALILCRAHGQVPRRRIRSRHHALIESGDIKLTVAYDYQF